MLQRAQNLNVRMSEEINELFNLEHVDLNGGYVLRALRVNDYDKSTFGRNA
jgi:hypothetical protein